MDIEELNKFQIVLLTLLVSFVTSIATGIVTVTLLQQAPQGVTETINHVVERTIETIVPSASSTPAKTTTSTQTVVVKEDDLVTGSIASALTKTGRVYGGTATSSSVVGLAAEIAPGVLITDAAVVSTEHLVAIGNTLALFSVAQTFPEIGIAVLKPEATSTVLGEPFTVADAGAVKLGSTVTAVLSVANARVAIGSVSALFHLSDASKKDGPAVSVRAIDTSLDASSITGAPLINIFGDLVGISSGVSSAQGRGTFVSASDIIALLSSKATSTPAE
jgi:hypothetical protein